LLLFDHKKNLFLVGSISLCSIHLGWIIFLTIFLSIAFSAMDKHDGYFEFVRNNAFLSSL